MTLLVDRGVNIQGRHFFLDVVKECEVGGDMPGSDM
jgi:hypothetical protein